MTAAWMWARAELRARWRAWLLLGVLAGVTVGVAAAGWAGARRTERAVPDAVAASRIPTAALLANDPSFGPEQRAEVAKLPGVTAAYPFLVGFSAQVFSPPRLGADSPSLFPVTPDVDPDPHRRHWWPDGCPIPARADEIVVDENIRDRFGLDIGATMVLGQEVGPRRGDPAAVRARRRRDQLPAAHDASSASRSRCRAISRGRRRAASTRSTASTCPSSSTSSSNLRGGDAGIPAFNAAGRTGSSATR